MTTYYHCEKCADQSREISALKDLRQAQAWEIGRLRDLLDGFGEPCGTCDGSGFMDAIIAQDGEGNVTECHPVDCPACDATGSGLFKHLTDQLRCAEEQHDSATERDTQLLAQLRETEKFLYAAHASRDAFSSDCDEKDATIRDLTAKVAALEGRHE